MVFYQPTQILVNIYPLSESAPSPNPLYDMAVANSPCRKVSISGRPPISDLVKISGNGLSKPKRGFCLRRWRIVSRPEHGCIGRSRSELECLSFLDSVTSNVQVCPLAIVAESGFYPSSPPAFPNSGRYPSKTVPSSERCASITAKPPLTSICRLTCASHLSTLTHGPEEGEYLPYHTPTDTKVIDANAGTE